MSNDLRENNRGAPASIAVPLKAHTFPSVSCEKWGSTRVLSSDRVLWYCSAIVFKGVYGQYGAVWARFVLVTSLLLCFRFGTLLTRHYRQKSID
jgi:hypothetical protein